MAAQQPEPARVLFICTANACRSQMGEHLSRAVYGDAVLAASAGVKPGVQVDPLGRAVLAELGVSTEGAHNKHVDAVALPGGVKYDLAVTVCSNAAGDCPTYRGTKRLLHAPFDDPPHLARDAAAAAAPGEAVDPLPFYRRVRDEILAWVTDELPRQLPQLAGKQRPLPAATGAAQ
jgi:arsenate reductase (thioredoxin)